MTQGSAGNLVAAELRRAERGRKTDGTRREPKDDVEEIIDPTGATNPQVTIDGPKWTQAEASAHEAPHGDVPGRIHGALPGEVNGHLDGSLVTPEVRRHRLLEQQRQNAEASIRGSAGNLAVQEMRRDGRNAGPAGVAPRRSSEVSDPATFHVTYSPAQHAVLGYQAEPAEKSVYKRPDKVTEFDLLQRRVERLEAVVQQLLEERHEKGIR